MWVNYLVQALLLASLALSVNLLVGYAGQVSVAHAAFAGIGGYTICYLATAHHTPYLLSLTVGAVIATAVGVVIGLIALGLAEEYLILMTLAFSVAVIGVFAMVIVGRNANLIGSIVGAVLLPMIEHVLRTGVALESTQAALVQLVLFGALLVMVMIARPQGLLPERYRHVGLPAPVTTGPRLVRDRTSRDGTHPAYDGAPVVLQADGLSKRYGGIVAAKDVSLELRGGTITALVGPNGAGKPTLFNLLTGTVVPDAGSVRLNGVELVGTRPDAVVHAGLVRTFQDVRLFGRLSCLENIMLAVPGQAGERVDTLFRPGRLVSRTDRAVAEQAMRWLDFVGLADQAGTSAEALSYGQSKLVSLARALATKADVLLLDEPASGVDTTWVGTMLSLIDAVRAEGRTVCLVEHNLDVVRELADHAYFMELGEITASGTIAELTSSARLAEAYFGAQ